MQLRDKYMTVAGHMLGFNPKDHDGHFTGLDASIGEVNGVRPDVNVYGVPDPQGLFDPWTIYPKPPPPHWHWSDKEGLQHKSNDEDEEFDFAKCEIQGPDTRDFEIDEKGVYQEIGRAHV